MRIQAVDYSVDLMQAILWQYNQAERLQAVLQQKQDWYDLNYTEFWTDWYRDVFNLVTANDFGLSVWALILGVPLTIVSDTPQSATVFGFGAFHRNFNRGNFGLADSGIRVSTVEKRLVLQLRYFQLVTRGAVPEINKFIAWVFRDYGLVYALDNYDMTMTYVFTFTPPSQLLYVLELYDVLPRPAGVGINYTVLVGDFFGFGAAHRNFNRGQFFGS